jgi:hypothetical protein
MIVKYLPSVSYQTGGPGFAGLHARGFQRGDGNHTGPLPSVGVYLDNSGHDYQGPLDIHVV